MKHGVCRQRREGRPQRGPLSPMEPEPDATLLRVREALAGSALLAGESPERVLTLGDELRPFVESARRCDGLAPADVRWSEARSLALLGSERAWVVHGADGLDELSTTGYTKVSECRNNAVQTFYVHPADFGLAKDGAAFSSSDSRAPAARASAWIYWN